MSKYFLHIDEPCTEDWDKMTPASQGRFCGSCQKTVFDFTNATDNDIIKHIEKMKGNMFCGQFEEGQLNRWMEKTSIKTSNPSLYKYLLSFLLLTAGQNAMAQEVGVRQENILQFSKADSVLMAEALKAEVPDKNCFTVRSQATAKLGTPSVIRLGGVRSISNSKQPIFVIDGIKINSSDINKFDPDTVESVSVLQAAKAQALFGSEGINGAIIITTKDFIYKKSKNKSKK
jgi:TonB-dependent SusC/RagA subfamily outer membrane receptor